MQQALLWVVVIKVIDVDMEQVLFYSLDQILLNNSRQALISVTYAALYHSMTIKSQDIVVISCCEAAGAYDQGMQLVFPNIYN